MGLRQNPDSSRPANDHCPAVLGHWQAWTLPVTALHLQLLGVVVYYRSWGNARNSAAQDRTDAAPNVVRVQRRSPVRHGCVAFMLRIRQLPALPCLRGPSSQPGACCAVPVPHLRALACSAVHARWHWPTRSLPAAGRPQHMWRGTSALTFPPTKPVGTSMVATTSTTSARALRGCTWHGCRAQLNSASGATGLRPEVQGLV